MQIIDYGTYSFITRKTFVLELIDTAIQGLLLLAVFIMFAGIIYMIAPFV